MMRVKREKGESSRWNSSGGPEVAEGARETRRAGKEVVGHEERQAGREAMEDAGEARPAGKLNAPERRRLRSRYKELKGEVHGLTGGVAEAGILEFRDIFEKVDKLHNQVEKPREQITDAELLIDITTELVSVAKGARVKGGMSAAEFAGAIIHNYCLPGGVDGDAGPRIDWEAFGLVACGILRHAPGVSTMVGPMDVELKPKKTPVSRRRERPTERTRPEEVEEVDPDLPSTETDANMQTMFGLLIKHCQVEIDRLIFNRLSFAQTVENLFALSFLVKDGRVKIKLEDGKQVVGACNAPDHEQRAKGGVLNTQFVFRLDYKCWELMQLTVLEGEELMPHRGSEDAENAGMPRSRTPIRKTSRNRARETPAVAAPSKDVEDAGEESSRRLKRRLHSNLHD